MPVKIVVPLRGKVDIHWVSAMNNLKEEVEIVENLPVDVARDFAASRLQPKFTHILFVDSDVIVPPNVVTALLSHGGEEIVSGVVTSRKMLPRPMPAAYRWKDGEFVNVDVDCYQEVDAVGAACLLVHRGVFEAIKRWHPTLPTFLWTPNRDERFIQSLPVPDKRMLRCSEDLWFCLLAKSCGYRIFVDPAVRCGHIIEHTF